MKKIFNIIFWNCIVLLILFIVSELVLRTLNIGYRSIASVVESDMYHHEHSKNHKVISEDHTSQNEYGGHLITFDEFGYRISENKTASANNYSILYLGDSFTEAAQVTYEDSYIGKIDSLTNYKYLGYNLGVSSYSPIMYCLQLKNCLSEKNFRKPRIVYIQIYSNDYRSDSTYAKFANFDSNDVPTRIDGSTYRANAMISILRESYLLRSIKTLLSIIEYKKSSNSDQEISYTNLVEEAPDIEENSRFSKSILQIDSILNEEKIEHYFLCIPSKYEAVSGDYTKNTFSRKFNMFAKIKNLPFVSLDSAFEYHSNIMKQDLFFEKDIHCNEAGNLVIAKILYEQTIK
jgi:hypothetical protein